MPHAILDEHQSELDGFHADRFVRYPELKRHGIPFSRQHIATLEAQGKFPKRVRLSARVIAWRLSEIRDWMARRGRE